VAAGPDFVLDATAWDACMFSADVEIGGCFCAIRDVAASVASSFNGAAGAGFAGSEPAGTFSLGGGRSG